MGETVRQYTDVQEFILRMLLAFRDLIHGTEHGASLEQSALHHGHARYQPCRHSQQ